MSTAIEERFEDAKRLGRAAGQPVYDLMELARRLDRPDLAEQIDRRLRALSHSTPFRIVVAGEIKRGKSSLINALLGVPNLLPVDADVCTAVHTVVEHSTSPRCEITLGDGSKVGVALEDLGSWASVAGQTAQDGKVHSVRVGLRNPLLEHGALLIDTPGINGRIRGHTDVTRAAVATADLVLFVLDGDTEMTAPERSFLHEILTHGSDVVVVVTKSDLPGSAAIVQRNRELLATRVEGLRSATVIAVSNTLKNRADLVARESGKLADARAVFDASGFAPLLALLVRRITSRDAGRAVTAIRSARSCCDQLVADVDRREAALTSDDPLATRRETQRREQELLEAAQGARTQIARSASVLKNDLDALIEHSANAIRERCDAHVAAAHPPSDVRQEAEAGLDAAWTEAALQLVSGMTGVAAEAASVCERHGFAELLEDYRPDAVIGRMPTDVEVPARAQAHAGDRALRYFPVISAPVAIGNLLGLVGLAGAAMPFIALPMMGAAFAIRRKADERALDRVASAEMITAALMQVTSGPNSLRSQLHRAVQQAAHDLDVEVDVRSKRRRGHLRSEAAELETLARTKHIESQQQLRELSATRAELLVFGNQLESIATRFTQSQEVHS